MTPQEIFDHVARAIIKQGRSAVTDDGCCYRIPGSDCRCAAGWLISDSVYDPSMEGQTIDVLLDSNLILFPSWMRENRDLIKRLQWCHDNVYDYKAFLFHFEKSMRIVARDEGLSAEVFNT